MDSARASSMVHLGNASLSVITASWMYGWSAWAQQSGRAGVFGGLSAGQVVSVQNKQGYIEIENLQTAGAGKWLVAANVLTSFVVTR